MAYFKFSEVTRRFGGIDHFAWFDRSYIIDWAFAAAIWFLARFVENSPVFEREFSLDDPLISHPHTKQQVGGNMNDFVAMVVPTAFFVFVAFFRLSVIELHHGLLGLCTATALNSFLTEFIKNRVGRLRPDFLARCDWDVIIQACTGKLGDVVDGRRSFPSGHSSSIFTGMGFLSFWLAGNTAAWCLSAPSYSGSLFASRYGRLLITLVPLLYATWVAITRIEDYRHHKEDIVVGSLLGLSISALCYRIYYPSPFVLSPEPDAMGRPKLLYKYNGNGTNNNHEFTRIQDDVAEDV